MKHHLLMILQSLGVPSLYKLGNLGYHTFDFFFNLLLWSGYIVAFTKVLKIYQIYHS
jgi:hypothetical protein